MELEELRAGGLALRRLSKGIAVSSAILSLSSILVFIFGFENFFSLFFFLLFLFILLLGLLGFFLSDLILVVLLILEGA